MFNIKDNIMSALSKVANEKRNEEITERIEDEYPVDLSYSPVPLTVALRKRKYEEEQYNKYGIAKDKTCDIR